MNNELLTNIMITESAISIAEAIKSKKSNSSVLNLLLILLV